MKWCLILSLFTMVAVGQDGTGDIIKVFQPAYNYKPVSTMSISSESGFCESTLLLNTDSTFTYEQGCEGKSRVTIGKWHQSNDTVKLISTPKRNVKISFKCYLSGQKRHVYTTFIITDKALKPISGFTIQPFNTKPRYVLDTQRADINYTINDLVDRYSTTNSGELKISKSKFDSLDFSKLNALTGRRYRIRNKNLPDTIRLMVNINAVAFSNYTIQYADKNQPRQIFFHDLKVSN